jgi:hypothetical protein
MRSIAVSALLLLSSVALHAGEVVKDTKTDAPAIPSEPVQILGGHAVYGEAMPAGMEPVELAAAMNARETAGDSEADEPWQLLSGKIGQVCQAKGCWMMLIDGDQAVRVKFGDHAFFLPKDIAGKALVLGRFERKEMTEAQARHMAEDAGEDPETIDGPQVEWRLEARSVLVMADA